MMSSSQSDPYQILVFEYKINIINYGANAAKGKTEMKNNGNHVNMRNRWQAETAGLLSFNIVAHAILKC